MACGVTSLTALVLVFLCYSAVSGDVSKLLIIITAQENDHNTGYAKLSQSFINAQTASVRDELSVEVILSSQTWPDLSGLWTFLPLMTEVSDLYANDNINWILMIPEHAEVNLKTLVQVTKRFDPKKPQFLGRAIWDTKRSIRHHYADPKMRYPDSSSGILLSWPLLNLSSSENPTDFNIDASHELATAFYNKGQGVSLTDVAEFCAPETLTSDGCATHYKIESYICPSSSLHKAVTEDDIFVMVKTGEVFHKTRVPLQKRLWTNKVKNIEICSEKEDKSIPTVKLNIKNTERGHCGKFYAILKRAAKEKHISSKSWVVIVDDDTIMNVTRLTELLSCYKSTDAIAIGERYGFKAHEHYGYDYITGGGGTVLSMTLVKQLINGGYTCRSDDDPDDMMLGAWLKNLEVPILHCPLFHQAPPSAYSVECLESQRQFAISFHKYDEDKPEQVAADWLGLTLEETNLRKKDVHTEL